MLSAICRIFHCTGSIKNGRNHALNSRIWQKFWGLFQFRMRLNSKFEMLRRIFTFLILLYGRDMGICLLSLNVAVYYVETVSIFFKSNRLGVWLFMSEMPYGTLSSDMLWRLFFVMHCADSEHLEQLCSKLQAADCKQRLKGWIPSLRTASQLLLR